MEGINRTVNDSIFIKERFIRLKNSLSDKNDLIEEFIDISEDNSINM